MMPVILQFGESDQDKLKAVLQAISASSRFEQSLETLISHWSQFVDEVERGYDDSIYEYTNDLGGRDLLARINTILSADGQAKLARILDSLDNRLRSAVVPARQSLGRNDTRKHEWWWHHVPLKQGSELHDDLVSEDLI